MFQLDDDFLVSVGLGDMPGDQKEAFKEHLLEELELRVGMRLSEGMSEDQLGEFEKLVNDNNEDGAVNWLETNRPDYKQVVADEMDKLRQEVSANSKAILTGEAPAPATDAPEELSEPDESDEDEE